MTVGPRPQESYEEIVSVNEHPLRVVPGTYQVQEAARFGEKISTGTLKYGDFNPYENAHAVSSFLGGYGLDAYASVENPEQFYNCYFESTDLDASRGHVILAPVRTLETTGLNAPAVWQGEITPTTGAFAGVTKWVAVGGTKVAYRNSDGSWTATAITLPANARKGAVAVFGGALVVGFGASAKAVYTLDLATTLSVQNDTAVTLYAFAITADQASLYIAGGPATSDTYKLTAGLAPDQMDSVLTSCGGVGDIITALAPGGGIVLLFVGRQDELGMIDFNGVYRSLVPLDTRLSTNNVGMRWFMGAGGEEQRGATSLVFPRDRSTWVYEPSSTTTGRADNISVWAIQGFEGGSIKGITNAIQGSARWLWYVMTDGTTGHSFLVKRDALSGATHPQLDLGANQCHSLGITSLFGTNPLLMVGVGNNIASIVLPLDGESPLTDSACQFISTGVIDMPDIDLGFPDEDKIPFTVRVVADNLLPGARSITVYANTDDSGWIELGTVSNSPSGEVNFPTGSTAKRVKLRFVLVSNDSAETPILHGFSLRASLNPKLYRIWSFQAYMPGGYHQVGGEDTRNSYELISAFWASRKLGIPLNYRDRWGDNWIVRLLKLAENETLREDTKAPETIMEMTLLEVTPGGGTSLWDHPLFTWDTATSLWGAGGP